MEKFFAKILKDFHSIDISFEIISEEFLPFREIMFGIFYCCHFFPNTTFRIRLNEASSFSSELITTVSPRSDSFKACSAKNSEPKYTVSYLQTILTGQISSLCVPSSSNL